MMDIRCGRGVVLGLLFVVGGGTVVGGQWGARPVIAQQAREHSSHLQLSRYTGVAQPSQEVVLALPEDGTIIDIAVEEGDVFEAGQILAVLDDRIQRQVVRLAELRAADTSGLERARADLSLAELELETVRELDHAGATTPQEVRVAEVRVQQALADERAAVAAGEQAQASLAAEQARLDRLHVVAPFSGRVIQRVAQRSATHRIGDPLLRIADLETLHVELPLPAELYYQLQPGARYLMHAEVPASRQLEATLLRVRCDIDAASETFIATFEIQNNDHALPPGFRLYLVKPQAMDE